MDKLSSTALGYGLLTLALFAYGIHTKKGWRYYVLTMLFVAPLGGTIGFALGKKEEAYHQERPPKFTPPTLPTTTVSNYEFNPLRTR
ncbi:MAG: hypothetical protein ACRBFS_21570 [Aureispira sp.]